MTAFLRIVGGLAVLLVLATPAAAMEVAMQDDLTVVHGYRDRDLALRQFKKMGGTTVRINIEHRRDSDELRNVRAGATRTALSLYDGAVDAVRAHGLKAQATLIWKRQQKPLIVARWMRNVAAHFGTRIQRYSILNEPDLLMEAACGKRRMQQLQRRFRGKFKTGRRGNLRAKVKTRGRTMRAHIACLRYYRGRRYRRIVRQAEREIHRVTPRAQILAGETSAQEGLDWFVRGAQPREMQIDGWAHHPFQLRDLTPKVPSVKWGIGSLPLLRRTLGVPIYLTEFGYPHPRSAFAKRAFGRRLKPRETARVLPIAWRLARRAGARQMLQYQWYVKPKWRTEIWETALLNKDDGRTTPAYRALRALIQSW